MFRWLSSKIHSSSQIDQKVRIASIDSPSEPLTSSGFGYRGVWFKPPEWAPEPSRNPVWEEAKLRATLNSGPDAIIENTLSFYRHPKLWEKASKILKIDRPIKLHEFNTHQLSLSHQMVLDMGIKFNDQVTAGGVFAYRGDAAEVAFDTLLRESKRGRPQISAAITRRGVDAFSPMDPFTGVGVAGAGVLGIEIEPNRSNILSLHWRDIGTKIDSESGRPIRHARDFNSWTDSPLKAVEQVELFKERLKTGHISSDVTEWNEAIVTPAYGEFYFKHEKTTHQSLIGRVDEENRRIARYRLKQGLPVELSTGYNPTSGIDNTTLSKRQQVAAQIRARRRVALEARQTVPRGVTHTDPLVSKAIDRAKALRLREIDKLYPSVQPKIVASKGGSYRYS